MLRIDNSARATSPRRGQVQRQHRSAAWCGCDTQGAAEASTRSRMPAGRRRSAGRHAERAGCRCRCRRGATLRPCRRAANVHAPRWRWPGRQCRPVLPAGPGRAGRRVSAAHSAAIRVPGAISSWWAMPFRRVNSFSWRSSAARRPSFRASGRSPLTKARSECRARSSVPIMAPVAHAPRDGRRCEAACSSDSSTRRVSRVWPSPSWISRAMRSRSLSRALSCWRTTSTGRSGCRPGWLGGAAGSCSRARRVASSRVRSSASIARRSSRQTPAGAEQPEDRGERRQARRRHGHRGAEGAGAQKGDGGM
jgi:hypothetical protein